MASVTFNLDVSTELVRDFTPPAAGSIDCIVERGRDAISTEDSVD